MRNMIGYEESRTFSEVAGGVVGGCSRGFCEQTNEPYMSNRTT